MKVPFVSLNRQIASLRLDIHRAIEDALRSSTFILGPHVSKFEKKFARFCHKKHCIALNSGTDALTLSLTAYGIGPGDEVITVPNTFFSTAMAASNVGARVVFVDCDPVSYTIDVTKIKQCITKRTKAIIPVHLFGQPADMAPVLSIAKEHHLTVIEDCCQAVNARYKGKRVPIGETGAFSFYPTKNLGALGDAGAAVTNNTQVADRIRYLHNNGSYQKYIHEDFGVNSRMDSIQAAILLAKLKHIDAFSTKRRELAHHYSTLLATLPWVRTPEELAHGYHVFHLYVIEAQRRDELQRFLAGNGVSTLIHYPIPLHLQKPYKALGYKKGDFLVTEQKSGSILSLPMFPELSVKEVEFVCKTIEKFYKTCMPVTTF